MFSQEVVTQLPVEVKEKIRTYIRDHREQLIDELKQLINIPSETGYETEVQAHIKQYMESELKLETSTFTADPDIVRRHPEYTESEVERKVGFENRPNVVGKWNNADGGRSLLMFTHIDTVPVGDLAHWDYDPFEGKIEGDIMYGRGTADNKGGFGSILAALKVIQGAGFTPKGNITAIAVVDEEVGGAGGAVAMAQQGFTADACVYPHPLTSGLGAQIACAGGLIFKVKVTGLAAHNLNGQIGVNAVGKALKIYEALVALDEKRAVEVSYPPFERYYAASDMPVRSTNLTPAMLHGGEWAYKVPAECELTGTVGYPPNETPEEVKAQIEAAIQTVVDADPWLQEHPPVLSWEWHTNASEISPDHPFVQMVKTNIDDVVGYETEIFGMPTFSDIRFPMLYMNIPALIYGPEGGNLHGANEWLNIEDWLQCVEITALNVLQWCDFK